MSEEKKTRDTTVDDDARIELRGTDPRVFCQELALMGSPLAASPSYPRTERPPGKSPRISHSSCTHSPA